MPKKHVFLVECPCDSGKHYLACCCPYHLEKIFPPTAEALMRSRFSAYALGKAAYLLFSWHVDTRPNKLDIANDGVKWLGLSIVSTELGGEQDNEGTVEFIARYKIGGRAAKLSEKSRFIRVSSCWKYLDGEIKDRA